ncbi:Lrp/AsnC family transcriptional regulator [Roseibium litorale]|uniref:Lrp/AsnC family transcriptional regulator n=1 Tax=Roseibium litorale TaxID=2803841 RepID=A0ABR9CTQ2_9HYPH|nr:Lrp/AsnC family transcriptional regulator [Roseibium litorale]MBD8894088.1 Lrp/AsnC family transcriptional regulator [Roseibium litorale]
MKRDLDQTDRRILAELQRNGRLTHQELSERVGLSPTPCARRVHNLETAGYINGYSARIDEEKMGFGLTAFLSVKLDQQIDDRLVSFEKALAACPEVVDCWLMTGTRDYLLRVAVSSMEEFERFLTGRLTKVPGVASIESSLAVRRVKGQMSRLG